MNGSVLCLSKTAYKTPLTRLTLHRGRTTQRNILSYHLNCPEKYMDTAQHIDCSTYGIHVRQSFSSHTSSSFWQLEHISSIQNTNDDNQCTSTSAHFVGITGITESHVVDRTTVLNIIRHRIDIQ